LSEIADFLSIFGRSTSAVTPSEKRSINTNKEVHYALSNEPKMNIVRCSQALHKRKVSEICTISCYNSETVRDRMSVTINH